MFCCVLVLASPRWCSISSTGFKGIGARGLLLAFALFLSGFVPYHHPHGQWQGQLSTLLAGFQSCLFRKVGRRAHNIHCFYRKPALHWPVSLLDALDKNQNQEWSKLAGKSVVAFSFAVGCAVSALVCTQMGIRASWLRFR